MQNNINIINMPPHRPLPTNARSRKRNSICRPHSHGRHQPPPSPPPHPCTEVKYIACAKHRGSAQCYPEILESTAKTDANCPHAPLPHQCTKHKTTRETQRRSRIRMDVIPPLPTNVPHQNKVNKRNTRQNPHSHGRHQNPSLSPPLQYISKSKLACAKSRESAKAP